MRSADEATLVDANVVFSKKYPFNKNTQLTVAATMNNKEAALVVLLLRVNKMIR